MKEAFQDQQQQPMRPVMHLKNSSQEYLIASKEKSHMIGMFMSTSRGELQTKVLRKTTRRDNLENKQRKENKAPYNVTVSVTRRVADKSRFQRPVLGEIQEQPQVNSTGKVVDKQVDKKIGRENIKKESRENIKKESRDIASESRESKTFRFQQQRLDNLFSQCQSIDYTTLDAFHEEVRSAFVDFSYQNLKNSRKQTKVRTFFRSVDYFDRCLHHPAREQETNRELVLMGLGCLYLASKVEDIYPLTMSQVLDSFGNNKFTKREIEHQEGQILMLLDFQVLPPLVIDALEMALEEVVSPGEQSAVYWEACLRYLRVILYSSWTASYPIQTLSRALVVYVFTLSGALFYESLSAWNNYLAGLLDQLQWNDQPIYECLQQISELVKSFPNSDYHHSLSPMYF